jgi:hypothetical protein
MILLLNDSKIRVQRPDINETQIPEIAGDAYETRSNPDRRKRRGCVGGARALNLSGMASGCQVM